eukprot:417324-Pelagomonas_calceolata.AAC.1
MRGLCALLQNGTKTLRAFTQDHGRGGGVVGVMIAGKSSGCCGCMVGVMMVGKGSGCSKCSEIRGRGGRQLG